MTLQKQVVKIEQSLYGVALIQDYMLLIRYIPVRIKCYSTIYRDLINMYLHAMIPASASESSAHVRKYIDIEFSAREQGIKKKKPGT